MKQHKKIKGIVKGSEDWDQVITVLFTVVREGLDEHRHRNHVSAINSTLLRWSHGRTYKSYLLTFALLRIVYLYFYFYLYMCLLFVFWRFLRQLLEINFWLLWNLILRKLPNICSNALSWTSISCSFLICFLRGLGARAEMGQVGRNTRQ